MLKNSTLIISLASLLLFPLSSFSNQTISTLESLEWNNRVILIRENNNCKNTLNHLIKAKLNIEERHIFWFLLCKDNQVISNFKGIIAPTLSTSLNKKYFSNNKKNVVLVGKDGGVKYRSRQLHLNEIDKLIDSMPMRQAEMRKDQN